jgi:DNA-binding NarL/FixJ family response regulator
MSADTPLAWGSSDGGLLAHWQRAFPGRKAVQVSTPKDMLALATRGPCFLWVDLAVAALPAWSAPEWEPVLRHPAMRVIAASSNPTQDGAIAALDAGCAAYCHAFSDAATLQQVQQVVEMGQVWVGKELMQRLLRSASRVSATLANTEPHWSEPLTGRERQVAVLAANGASNQAIARDCDISERTVKAHLSAAFSKLNITDRLQLALRVHGIS